MYSPMRLISGNTNANTDIDNSMRSDTAADIVEIREETSKQSPYITRAEIEDMFQRFQNTMVDIVSQKNKKDNNGKKKSDKSYKPKNYIIALESSSDEDRRSFTITPDTIKYMNSTSKHIYENIPRYDGKGDIKKLLDFIDKADDYLKVANLKPEIVVKIISGKLSGQASTL